VAHQGAIRNDSESGSEDLRARVLRVATQLFADRGFVGTSVREVAEAAGCTKPALYYHYQSKQGLFLAALRAQAEALGEPIERACCAEGSVRQRLTEAVRAVVGYARSDPHGLLLLYRASRHPEEGQPDFDFASVQEAPLAMARTLLAEGLERGELRPELDLEDAVFALQGLVDQRCCSFISGGKAISDDFPERALALLFDGVGR